MIKTTIIMSLEHLTSVETSEKEKSQSGFKSSIDPAQFSSFNEYKKALTVEKQIFEAKKNKPETTPVQKEHQSVFENQNVIRQKLTPEELSAFIEYVPKEYEQYLLMDNTIGRIDELNVQRMKKEQLYSIMYAFPDRKINYVFHPEQKSDVEEIKTFLSEMNINTNKLTFIESEALDSVWARDQYLQAKDTEGHTVLIEPNEDFQELRKFNDGMTIDMGVALNLKTEQVQLYFEGGDMRAVGPYMFVGEKTFKEAMKHIPRSIHNESHWELPNGTIFTIGQNSHENTLMTVQKKLAELGITDDPEKYFVEKDQYNVYKIGGVDYPEKAPVNATIEDYDKLYAERETALKQEYQKLFGREVHIVGEGDTEKQAVFHIDMFINFLPNPPGKPTVMLASYKETQRLLENLSDEEMEAIEDAMTKSQAMNKASYKTLNNADNNNDFHDFRNSLVDSGRTDNMQKKLDAATQWFQSQGFNVIRTPMIDKIHRDRDYISSRSYNNCLTEVYSNKEGELIKRIYIPSFGITPLEKHLVEVYNKMGYEVIPVENLHILAEKQGVLNCATSETRSGFISSE